jgi:hypothetical protein
VHLRRNDERQTQFIDLVLDGTLGSRNKIAYR